MGFNPFSKHDWEDVFKGGGGEVEDAFNKIVKEVEKEGNKAVSRVEDKAKHVTKRVEDKAQWATARVEEKAQRVITRVEREGEKVVEGLPALAEEAVAEALNYIQSEAFKTLLNKVIDLAENAAPRRLAEIPILPCSPVTPGIGVAIDLKENIGTLQKYYNDPPQGQQGYLGMLRELAGDQDAIILLPGGNGKVYVPVEVIDKELSKLL